MPIEKKEGGFVELKFNEKNLVTKSNQLIEASYRMSVLEKKLILALISQVQPDDVDFQAYRFSVKDLSNFLGITRQNIYQTLDEITDKILSHKIKFYNDQDEHIKVGWISSYVYEKRTGFIRMRFDPELKPYLIKLKEAFTYYQLSNIVKLRSFYSIRVYELLKQYQKIGNRRFSIKELRRILGVKDDDYKLYADFKKKTFLVAQKELQEKTDIRFEYKESKTGKKVTGIEFIIFKNKKDIINIEPIEGGGVPEAEDAKKQLYERMTKYFKLSAGQALEILGKFEPDGIEAKLKAIEEMNQQGKVKSLGAYTYKAFMEDYNLGASLFDLEKQEAEKAKREAGKLLKAWEAEHLEALNRKREIIKAGLGEDEKAELITALRDRYKDNKFMLPKFEKEGLNNPLVLASYENLITEKFLKPEEYNFVLWVKMSKGREIAKDQAGIFYFID